MKDNYFFPQLPIQAGGGGWPAFLFLEIEYIHL